MGWASSNARPGGNVTGQWRPTEETVAKSIELLADTVPSARRMASLANLSLTTAATRNQVALATAEGRGLELLLVDVPTPSDLEPAMERARAWGAELLMAEYVIPLNSPLERVPDLVRRARLPAAGWRPWVERGLLMAYGPDVAAGYRRMAWYVARILEGTPPGDLPIEKSAAFEFVVNRATLADLGLTLPEHVALNVTHWID